MAQNMSGKLWILTGGDYLVFDGETVKDVSEVAYIPTTVIGAAPSGGGELFESPNLVQPKRKNEFIPPELDLRMKQSVVRKIAYPSGYMGGKHNLGLSALKNLLYQLADPIAIIENPQSNSRGLVSKIILTE